MRAPSLLFMAQPATEVWQAMQHTITAEGWDRQLGDALFDPRNWHQSLSHPLPFSVPTRDCMMNVGARIDAAAFTMVLDSVRGSGKAEGPKSIRWAFHATKRPPGFDALLVAIRNALAQEGLEGMPEHSSHVTISYWAPSRLAATKIRPIAWRVDELLLVESRGHPYHYHPLARWPLRTAPAGLESQVELW